ncbi:MAG: hypothetical protein GXO35_01950, partial [Gammaproteobacteria bacterium]|nr:hypothetical protein [Gammaproteobacteria bacterium]
ADNINANGQVVSADRYAQSEYLALAAYNIAVGPSADEVDAVFVNIDFPIIKGRRSHYFSVGVARLIYDESIENSNSSFSTYCRPTSKTHLKQGLLAVLSDAEGRRVCVNDLSHKATPLLPIDLAKLGRMVGIATRILAMNLVDSGMYPEVERSVVEELTELEASTVTVVYDIRDQIHFLKLQMPVPAFAIAGIEKYHSQYKAALSKNRALHISTDLASRLPPLEPIF